MPKAGDDPWHGHTLEWLTQSPPTRKRFEADELPPVDSETPLLDARLAELDSGRAELEAPTPEMEDA